jgi:hypothetical protein
MNVNVKGTVYLTGKTTVTAAFGEERWNSFMAKLAAKDKFFSNVIMSVTPVPLEKLMFFLDEMTTEYFNNDKNSYLMFGKVAAKFALSEGGVYSSHLLTKDIKQFVASGLPKLWSTYYDGGAVTTRFENNIVHLKITGLTIKNFNFESLVMGFFQQAIKMFGKKTIAKRVRSISSGDNDIYFQFGIKDP